MTSAQTMIKAVNVVATLREAGELMPIQMAHAFLLIMARPGITMSQLAELAGISQSSCSRNVAALGKWHRLNKPGYGLVEAVEDPTERRRKAMFLTPKGRKVARRVVAAIDPEAQFGDLYLPSASEHYDRIIKPMPARTR